MKRLVLPLFLMLQLAAPAVAQHEAVIDRIEISGVDENLFSASLRDDLQKLTGQSLDTTAVDALVDRMQVELPDYVVASRTTPVEGIQGVRLVFVVAPISEHDPLGSNINSRYPVDSVEIEGVSRSSVSDVLFGEMQNMVGQGLNNDEAERFRERLSTELGSSFDVVRKVERSFRPRQLRIVYDVFRIPWLPFREPKSFVSYHSQQGYSFAIGTGGGKARRKQSFQVSITNNGDELIERYAGFRVGYENIQLGTDRLGLKLAYSSYRNQWSVHTVSPELYRRRRNFEASIAIAADQHLYFTTGISASNLELQTPPVRFEPSRAGTASVNYRRTFTAGPNNHEVEASYEIHAGSNTLDSEFIYTRHAWSGQYIFRLRRQSITVSQPGSGTTSQNVITNEDRGQSVSVSAAAGRITGNAPMFERFVLGNSTTLRGWNKYDFAPLGGDRYAYGSLEYNFRGLELFADVGSVWNSGEEVKIRSSVGIGFGGEGRDPFFLGLAVPIDEDGMTPTFMVVCRFTGF